MLVFKTAHHLRSRFKSNLQTIGLVPTMGALHKGHLSLVKKACEENDKVVVSIYVNPTQFNEVSDLKKYPSNLEKDLKLLQSFSNQVVLYTPDHKDLYPDGIQSKTYDFGTIAAHMEGEYRVGHFEGVATVVEALFRKIQPQKAYFGEKDFQQLQIIKALNAQKKTWCNHRSMSYCKRKRRSRYEFPKSFIDPKSETSSCSNLYGLR